MPMSDELKWLLKEGVGVFSRVLIFLLKIRPLHTQSSLCVICTCSDFAMPLLSCACLCNNSKSCLPSFVSSFPCTALLLLCFLLNITACTVAKMGGRTFERKAPIATILLKKWGGRIFECGLIFRRLW